MGVDDPISVRIYRRQLHILISLCGVVTHLTGYSQEWICIAALAQLVGLE